MIAINGIEIEVGHFPDGTQMLLNFPIDHVMSVASGKWGSHMIEVDWQYERDEELVTLYFLMSHLKEVTYAKDFEFVLYLYYIPNARMDRVKSKAEVFTLKHFCRLINEMGFDRVYTLDPHSNVSEALINNLTIKSVEPFIKYAIDDIEGVGIDGGEKYGGTSVIYFPDAGAMKRYSGLKVFGEREIIYGSKERDWKTGVIKGLKILNRDGEKITDEHYLDGKTVMMIDDIVSYGGTFAYSADALRKLGASAVYGYVTHTENSVLDEEKGKLLTRLNSGVVDELFTTNSIYTGKHERITRISKFYDGK
jgi:ribose-phosphate pyrophosphokinase